MLIFSLFPIAGSVTIDYGPFGFLDAYDPYFIPNHSDDHFRPVIFKLFWFKAPFLAKNFWRHPYIGKLLLWCTLEANYSIDKFHKEYQQIARKSNISLQPLYLFMPPWLRTTTLDV